MCGVCKSANVPKLIHQPKKCGFRERGAQSLFRVPTDAEIACRAQSQDVLGGRKSDCTRWEKLERACGVV